MAGGQDKILWSLSLEGADDVSKKLKAAGDVGDAQAKRLQQSFEGVGSGASGSSGIGKFQAETEQGESAAHRLREAIHVLHPVLDEAGLGLGNLGSLARVAGIGFGAFATAALGSLLIGLAKIGEESDKAGLRLKALGSGDAFEKLKQQAKELGVSTESLIPSFEKFAASKNKINADQSSGLIRLRPNGPTEADQAAAGVRILGVGGKETGAQVPDSVFLGAQKALVEGAQGEKISGDEAGKIADAFAGKLLENRKLTPEAVDTLNPASQNILAKSLSSFFGTDVSTGAELKERLARPGQQAPSDREVFRSLNDAEPAARGQAEAARGVTAAFDALVASTKRLAEEFSGDVGLAGALQKLANLIEGAAEHVDQIIHPQDYQPGGKKFIGPVRQEDQPTVPKSLGEVFSSEKGDLLGRLVGYLRQSGETGGFKGGNPFADTLELSKRFATEPGSFQEKARPAEGPHALNPVSPLSPTPSKQQPAPPGYDRTYDGILIRNSEPVTSQPDASLGPHSENSSSSPVRFKTASPLVNITDKDIDNAIGVALSAGPGSIAEATRSLGLGTKLLKPATPASEGSVVGYHGTSGENLDSIAKNGIDVGEDKNAWVAARESFAAFTAETKSGGVGKGNPVVLEVTIPADKFQDAFQKLNRGGNWSTASTDKNIPPEWISGFRNVDKETGKLGPLQTLPPQPITNGPRSEAEPVQPQQVASLGSALQSVIESVSAALNDARTKDSATPSALGIRGEAQPIDESGATSKVADLGTAAEEAAQKLRSVQAPAGTEPVTVHADGGGHIRGPGTSTSDSIPAMLSDGEFVVKADAVKKIGVDKLDQANRTGSVAHFAKGGVAGTGGPTDTKDPAGGLRGNVDVTYDPNTGGAYINNVLHMPGDPLLETPIIKQAIERSKASMNDKSSSSRKHKSDFVGAFGGDAQNAPTPEGFAEGGLVGDRAARDNVAYLSKVHFATGGLAERASGAAKIAAHLTAMGLDNVISMPHLAVGGMPAIATPDLETALDKPASSAMEHWGTIDMRSDHGDFKVATEHDTMRHLSSSAKKAKRFSTGAKPSWYGGGS